MARVTSSGNTSQLRKVPALSAAINLISGGKPSIACYLRAYALRATCLLVYAASLASVVASLVVCNIVNSGVITIVGRGDEVLGIIAFIWRGSGSRARSQR